MSAYILKIEKETGVKGKYYIFVNM